MVDFEIAATKGQMARDVAEWCSASREQRTKPKRIQERKRCPYSVYVATVRVAYEMYDCDEWVHVPDSDDETDVVEAYIHKPSRDVLANIAAKEEAAVLKFWKDEGHDVGQVDTEVAIDLAYLYRSIVTCGNMRVTVSVELTKTKLKA